MKSRLAIYTLLTPLSFSAALYAAAGPEGPVPSNGIVVTHSNSPIYNPHDLLDLRPDEIYTTFKLKEEAGIAYCLSPQLANYTKLGQDGKPQQVAGVGPFIVRSYDSKIRKETGAALTEDGLAEIEFGYAYDDANQPTDSNVIDVQLEHKGRERILRGEFRKILPKALGIERQSAEWVKLQNLDGSYHKREKGQQAWVLKKTEPTVYETPEETSARIMTNYGPQVTEKLKDTITENQGKIDAKQVRIDSLTSKSHQICNVYTKDIEKICTGDARRNAIEQRTKPLTEECEQSDQERNKLLDDNAKFMGNLKSKFFDLTAIIRVALNKSIVTEEQLFKNKEQLKKAKQIILHTQKDRAQSFTFDDRRNTLLQLEDAVHSAMQHEIGKSEAEVEEYAKEAYLITQYTVGLVNAPSVLSREQALKEVLGKTKLNEDEKRLLESRILSTESSEAIAVANKDIDVLVNNLHALHNTPDEKNLDDQFIKHRASAESLQQIVNDQENTIRSQEGKLSRTTQQAASILSIMQKHYAQRGMSEGEFYNKIVFTKSTPTENKHELTNYFKDAVSKYEKKTAAPNQEHHIGEKEAEKEEEE